MSYPPPFPPYGPGPVPPTPKAKSKLPWVIGGAVLLLAIIIGSASGGGESTTRSRPSATSGAGSGSYSPAPPQVVDVPSRATPSGPLATFSSGTYEVGTGDGEVAPGKYKTTGPEAGDWGSCYWARLKDTSGGFDSIIANGNAEGPTTVTIGKSDGAFETRCTWTRAG